MKVSTLNHGLLYWYKLEVFYDVSSFVGQIMRHPVSHMKCPTASLFSLTSCIYPENLAKMSLGVHPKFPLKWTKPKRLICIPLIILINSNPSFINANRVAQSTDTRFQSLSRYHKAKCLLDINLNQTLVNEVLGYCMTLSDAYTKMPECHNAVVSDIGTGIID